MEEAIYRTRDNITDIKQQQKEHEKQYQMAIQTEIKNEFGIMAESRLNLKIIEANNLTPVSYGGSLDAYCKVDFGDQFFDTQVKYKTLNPVWNEGMTFDASWIEQKPNETNAVITIKV